MSNKNQIYDYVVVGSGFSGLCIASELSQKNSNVLLIDSNDKIGVNHHSVNTQFGAQNNGLRFFPDTAASHQALQFLNHVIKEEVSFTSLELPPVTYDAGVFKSFLGFGDNPPAFYSEMEYFTAVQSLTPSIPVHQWPEKIFAQFKGEYLSRSYVTKFVSENDQVSHCIVNGSKHISGRNFIYTGPVRDLHVLLPQDALNVRARAKLAKNNYWHALCLDLVHNGEITQQTAMHILNGTTQDEIGPCIGGFLPAEQKADTEPAQTYQYSQWLTFIDYEDAEETENVGAALKKIKRQIKRAYPNALENLLYERIAVFPFYGGNGDLKLEDNQSLPNLSNLWIGSPQMNEQKNIVGSLLQAEKVCSELISAQVESETASL